MPSGCCSMKAGRGGLCHDRPAQTLETGQGSGLPLPLGCPRHANRAAAFSSAGSSKRFYVILAGIRENDIEPNTGIDSRRRDRYLATYTVIYTVYALSVHFFAYKKYSFCARCYTLYSERFLFGEVASETNNNAHRAIA